MSILSIPPSRQWEGVDGRWSTFEVQLGTPWQSVRLLPGTSATACDSIWAIGIEGCELVNTNLSDCANKRGNLFLRNQSTSYLQQRLPNNGLFSLALYEEEQLGLTDSNAYYGFDDLRLPTSDSSLTFRGQTIAAIATNNFFLGSLGLSPYALNITDFNTPIPSLLGTLRNQSVVNSTSWAYTAGKSYTNPDVYGSLTFGGYDSARANQSEIQVPFYKDVSRDLVVGLQSITYDSYGSSPLLSSGIYAFLDSLVVDMWLPQSACDAFAKAFNLTWSSDLAMYYVTEPAHKALIAQQPTFMFTLGLASSGGNTTQISFPYAAFDLNKTVPDISSTVGTNRYFPLKRAANSSQYTLGRVFFQEAYVVADYDQMTFSVSQAGNSSALKLVSLAPIEVSPVVNGQPTGVSNSVWIGISAAALVITIALIAIAWLYIRRRISRKRNAEAIAGHKVIEADSEEKNELGGGVDYQYELDQHEHAIHELRQQDAELPASKEHAELVAEDRYVELAAGRQCAEPLGDECGRHELPT